MVILTSRDHRAAEKQTDLLGSHWIPGIQKLELYLRYNPARKFLKVSGSVHKATSSINVTELGNPFSFLTNVNFWIVLVYMFSDKLDIVWNNN